MSSYQQKSTGGGGKLKIKNYNSTDIINTNHPGQSQSQSQIQNGPLMFDKNNVQRTQTQTQHIPIVSSEGNIQQDPDEITIHQPLLTRHSHVGGGENSLIMKKKENEGKRKLCCHIVVHVFSIICTFLCWTCFVVIVTLGIICAAEGYKWGSNLGFGSIVVIFCFLLVFVCLSCLSHDLKGKEDQKFNVLSFIFKIIGMCCTCCGIMCTFTGTIILLYLGLLFYTDSY